MAPGRGPRRRARPGGTPVLMNTRSASSTPPVHRHLLAGPVNRASAQIRSSPAAASIRRRLPARKLLTMARLRSRTRAMSTATGPVLDAVVGAAPGEVGHPGARHHGLGGRTALVDAGAADVLALDQRRPPPAPGQRGGEGTAGLAGADDDGIVPLGSAHGSDVVGGETASDWGCNDSEAAGGSRDPRIFRQNRGPRYPRAPACPTSASPGPRFPPGLTARSEWPGQRRMLPSIP